MLDLSEVEMWDGGRFGDSGGGDLGEGGGFGGGGKKIDLTK